MGGGVGPTPSPLIAGGRGREVARGVSSTPACTFHAIHVTTRAAKCRVLRPSGGSVHAVPPVRRACWAEALCAITRMQCPAHSRCGRLRVHLVICIMCLLLPRCIRYARTLCARAGSQLAPAAERRPRHVHPMQPAGAGTSSPWFATVPLRREKHAPNFFCGEMLPKGCHAAPLHGMQP